MELQRVTVELDILKMLQEEDEVISENVRLDLDWKGTSAEVRSTRSRLAMVETQLRKLEEEMKSLLDKLDEGSCQLKRIERDRSEVTQRQKTLVKQYSTIRQQMDRLGLSRAGGNWFETLIETQLNEGTLSELGRSAHSHDLESNSGSDSISDIGTSSSQSRVLRAGYDRHENNDKTPLSWAVSKGHKSVARLLIERGAESSKLLLRAVKNADETQVRLLLDSGADAEASDEDGKTPVAIASENGHDSMTQLLLEKGADGSTCLSRAVEEGDEAVAWLLLDKGVNCEVKDHSEKVPLAVAAEKGHEKLVRLLLGKGADVDAKSRYGRTPLSWAAEAGHDIVARLLLDKGAGVEAKNHSDRTPLSWAAENGHEGVARLLLDKGASADSKDHAGRTPLMLARANGHETLARLMRQKSSRQKSRTHPSG